MATVISVENLGKKYTISHQQRGDNSSLREVITNSVTSFGSKLIKPFRTNLAPCPLPHDPASEDFWALKGVSFEVKQGDRIGVIGRNGAGKSTLLKILSRITEPTTGRVRIKGRVASLLEVGTGFHPELTGRENIYLNGAILGMQREEIRLKFDEIVAFAEIERFLDTPVKRYSSGMYVRLAFAVAAHLEPEILIVDEVLAVGDAAFQKKCLGRMGESARDGRTVLFVSHNMAAINNLCNRGLYLKDGMLHTKATAGEAVHQYLQDSLVLSGVRLAERSDRQGSGLARFISVDLLDSQGTALLCVQSGQEIVIRIRLESRVRQPIKNPVVALGFDDGSGLRVWHVSNESSGQLFAELDPDHEVIEVKIPKFPLVAGSYSIVLFLSSNDSIVDWIQNAVNFTVELGDFFDSGKLPPAGQGFFLADYSVAVTNHV